MSWKWINSPGKAHFQDIVVEVSLSGRIDHPRSRMNSPGKAHIHNYVLEVSLSGRIDPATGMIANLADLDAFVERHVLEEFDHRSLNEDVAAFRHKVPTTENLCIEIFHRLKHFPHAQLELVRIQETGNNSFEYAGNTEGDRL